MGKVMKKKPAPPLKPARRESSRTKRKPAVLSAKKGRFRLISEDEFARLWDSLREANETLNAIRTGEVDAVVVTGTKGNQIYSLSGAEQPYRIYVERMQEGAVTVSADALILYCNQKFADMVQLPLERVIGSQLPTHLNPEAWRKIAGIFQGRKDVVKHESVLRRVGGVEIPVHLTANRLPMQDQNVMCLVVTDFTAQKKHEKVRLDKEVAEKASLAKDDFLAALSHELRTPLTPVLMTAMAMEQMPDATPELRESLALIRRNVELEARLIDDLLDLTRIVKGKMELHLGQVDLHALVQRALEICHDEFSAKEQKVTLRLEAGHHLLEGDPVRIQQAMWNLIRNATKFTGPKGSILVRTGNPVPDRILFEVEDTGIGFEPQITEKLFKAFEQGGRQITRQFGGLGLGLAITRSIVEAHGGVVRARSGGSGKGASFTLEIPVRPTTATELSAAPADGANRPFAPKQILLVEDHKDTRTSLEFLLKKARHEVKSAATAREALELAAANHFDLVISDIGLPDQNGLELMQQLRDRYNLEGIGLSGYGMEEDIAKGEAAGFIQYLTKPVRFEQLQRIIG
jgi:PAS domain S-box-containing protein